MGGDDLAAGSTEEPAGPGAIGLPHGAHDDLTHAGLPGRHATAIALDERPERAQAERRRHARHDALEQPSMESADELAVLIGKVPEGAGAERDLDGPAPGAAEARVESRPGHGLL